MAAMNENEEFEFRLRAEQEAAQNNAPEETTIPAMMRQQLGNIGAGAVRGAGSIGATLLSPLDAAARAMGIQNAYIGRADRRQAMTEGLRELGAQPESLAFQGGKLGAEIAGTAGVGGALGKGVGLLSQSPKLAPFISALTTGGMKTGAAPGVANMLTRIAGGGITGGATAGLINPEYAPAGFAIGGAMPPAVKAAGMAGQKIGQAIRGPGITEAQRQVLKSARDLGYVVPPTQAKPSMFNRAMEGMAGKLTTAQNASAKNQAVTNRLARKALGIKEDVPITPEILDNIRAEAGKIYEATKSAGKIATDAKFFDDLQNITKAYHGASRSFPGVIKSDVVDLVKGFQVGNFDSGDAIEAIKILRENAKKAYAAGDHLLGKANKNLAGSLESQIERHLAYKANAATSWKDIDKVLGRRMSGTDFDAMKNVRLIAGRLRDGKITKDEAMQGLSGIQVASKTAKDALSKVIDAISSGSPEQAKETLNAYQAARQIIAKTYSVEDALNATSTGNVNAAKLAAQLKKGKPLTGELKQVAQFAENFPKAVQVPEKMGSLPQLSPLDYLAAFGATAATQNPAGMAGLLARPAARSAILSGPVQNRLAKEAGTNALLQFMETPEAQQLMYRAAPVLSAQ